LYKTSETSERLINKRARFSIWALLDLHRNTVQQAKQGGVSKVAYWIRYHELALQQYFWLAMTKLFIFH